MAVSPKKSHKGMSGDKLRFCERMSGRVMRQDEMSERAGRGRDIRKSWEGWDVRRFGAGRDVKNSW
jgi:hypothetical protein